MSDLTIDKTFKHQKVSNLYSQVPVCEFCQAFYRKIDVFRNQVKFHILYINI